MCPGSEHRYRFQKRLVVMVDDASLSGDSYLDYIPTFFSYLMCDEDMLDYVISN